jgi:hypothetical protein
MSLRGLLGRLRSSRRGSGVHEKEHQQKENNNIKTWSDRLIDRENYWLIAINMEEDGKPIDALQFYIKDAIRSLELSLYNKAALSCSCSAKCFENIRSFHYARIFHMEAATLYEYNADYILGDSIRESLWSLKEAYEQYMLAREFDRAKIVHDKYISLSIKTNPFSELETRTDPATEKYTEQVMCDNRSSSLPNSNTLQIHEEMHEKIHEENVVPPQVIHSIEKFSQLKDFVISGIQPTEENVLNMNIDYARNKEGTIVKGSPL